VSNILKIFFLWSERTKYYPLFALKLSDFTSDSSQRFILDLKRAEQDNGEANVFTLACFEKSNLLDILFQLIDSAKCSETVIDYVVEIIYNFVSFADFKPDERDELVKSECLPFDLTHLNEQFKDEKGILKICGFLLYQDYNKIYQEWKIKFKRLICF
jgi:hypothetical protein